MYTFPLKTELEDTSPLASWWGQASCLGHVSSNKRHLGVLVTGEAQDPFWKNVQIRTDGGQFVASVSG